MIDETISTYTAEEAIELANLWRAGKTIGGDEDEVIFALLDEVKRLRDWRPIETAPKDRFVMLHYNPPFGVISPEIAHWMARRGEWVGCSGYVFQSEGIHAPTHWMPLPDPPK